MREILKNVRPFSPPFSGGLVSTETNSAVITRKNNETVFIGRDRLQGNNNTIMESNGEENDDTEMVEVIYDPVWNCYYNPKTNAYYELKE